jgi:ferredoxin
MNNETKYTITLPEFHKLFLLLQDDGYAIVGPTIKEQAIVYDDLQSVADLPVGWTDDQQPGVYRIKQRDDGAYFGYNVGPHSWKKYLFPPRRKLWESKRENGSLTFHTESCEGKKMVFLGMRSCEIEAMFIQDKVFIEGNYVDPFYKNQRDMTLIIAVNCTQAASTCFCLSMDTGPKSKRGYDIALTEIINSEEHYFVVDIGTERGESFIKLLDHSPVNEQQSVAEEAGIEHARHQMSQGQGIDTTDINKLLFRNMESPHWEDVAKRCLSCANCTMVCPTCFCSDTEEINDLTGDHTERWKSWDSCFNADHSYLNGDSVRSSTKSRYRQWLTHKLGTWIDQFGTSGCVGCGRCVTWCPVGIDLREEVAKIRLLDEGQQGDE